MSNSIVTQPVVKLYKRCARKHHAKCEGSFQNYSVCSCECHTKGITSSVTIAGREIKETVTYLTTDAEWDNAVAEAQAIVSAPKPKTVKAPASKITKTTRKALPRNIMGGAKCVLSEGFKPVGGTWKTYKGDWVKVTLKPEHRFPESRMATPEEIEAFHARDRVWRDMNGRR